MTKLNTDNLEEALKAWLLLPGDRDEYPDFAFKKPAIFKAIFDAETHLPQKMQYLMGAPLALVVQYLKTGYISIEDVLSLFLKVDMEVDELLEILRALPLDMQVYSFYRLVSFRIQDINPIFEQWTDHKEWPELNGETRADFQKNCATKLTDWVISIDAPMDAGLPFIFLGVLDSEEPCQILSLALEQLEGQLDRTVLGRIKDKHTLLRLIKVSIMVASIPDYFEGYQDWISYLEERFLQTLLTLEEKSLISMLSRLPQYLVDRIVAQTFNYLESDIVVVQENSTRLWKSFWSISSDRCATLSIALASNPSYLDWEKET